MTPEEYAEKIIPHNAVYVSDAPNYLREQIADAILKAVTEENEACARILDAAANRQKAAWDMCIADNNLGPFTSYEEVFRGFADDIRARANWKE